MAELPARRLTRSLDPLPSESLAGFLLRLAWRLRVTPHRLAQAIECSNTAATQLSQRLLINLNIPLFAQATALTPDEAAELTLLTWADRYPPIAHTAGTAAAEGPKKNDRWLFHHDLRYCPACLAGDGSPAQQYYGGPWKKAWHLPIAFACPQHRAFLRDICPRRHPPDTAPGRLITPASEWVLHPVQCRCPADPNSPGGRRRPCCGARLDQPHPQAREPSPATLNAQQRLLDLLGPASSPEHFHPHVHRPACHRRPALRHLALQPTSSRTTPSRPSPNTSTRSTPAPATPATPCPTASSRPRPC